MRRVAAWLGRSDTEERPTVLSLHRRGDVRVEGKERKRALRIADRVALVAHWDPLGRVSRSTDALLSALAGHDFETVLVSAAPGNDALRWSSGSAPEVTVLRRPNLGYDFGSWATALARYPRVRERTAVLLLNDSLVGPFASMAPLLDHFLGTEADVWGMTTSNQLRRHVQSYALGFRGGALDRPRLRSFWDGIRVEAQKERTVIEYEIGLSRLASGMGLSTDVMFPWEEVVGRRQNPTLDGWLRLLELGFPFVKRALVTGPGVGSNVPGVEEAVARYFGVRLSEWL